jgi:hypothetical protein
MFRSTVRRMLAAALICSLTGGLRAEEGEWKVLFDGSDRAAWQSAGGGEPSPGWVVEDDVLVRGDRAGYIWTKDRFGDFRLELEFLTEGNSGVFIRTDNLGNPVQTGIEVQIDVPRRAPSKNSSGALYDLAAPTQVADRPSGEWNELAIVAKGSRIQIVMNGQQIIDADLDQWTEPNRNPDGSRNKFDTALKDFKREGHIGFQDHGAKVAFRNVRIKRLD